MTVKYKATSDSCNRCVYACEHNHDVLPIGRILLNIMQTTEPSIDFQLYVCNCHQCLKPGKA